jgi:hypothetical protein
MFGSRPVRSLLVVGLAAVMLGCGETGVPSPSPTGVSIFFPRRPPPIGLRPVQAALVEGGLVVSDGCVWIVDGPERLLVVWPSEYSAAFAAGTLVILGPDNSILAQEGQMVVLSGGETSRNVETAREAVLRLTGLELPAECPAELVWNATSIVPPDRLP